MREVSSQTNLNDLLDGTCVYWYKDGDPTQHFIAVKYQNQWVHPFVDPTGALFQMYPQVPCYVVYEYNAPVDVYVPDDDESWDSYDSFY